MIRTKDFEKDALFRLCEETTRKMYERFKEKLDKNHYHGWDNRKNYSTIKDEINRRIHMSDTTPNTMLNSSKEIIDLMNYLAMHLNMKGDMD